MATDDLDTLKAHRGALRGVLAACLRQMANPDPLHPAYKAAQEKGGEVYRLTAPTPAA